MAKIGLTMIIPHGFPVLISHVFHVFMVRCHWPQELALKFLPQPSIDSAHSRMSVLYCKPKLQFSFMMFGNVRLYKPWVFWVSFFADTANQIKQCCGSLILSIHSKCWCMHRASTLCIHVSIWFYLQVDITFNAWFVVSLFLEQRSSNFSKKDAGSRPNQSPQARVWSRNAFEHQKQFGLFHFIVVYSL